MHEPRTKILAIDDHMDNLISLGAVVDEYLDNCEIIKATSGLQGLDLAIQEQPDTIILDIIMPEMDGFEVCAKLKQNKLTAHIPVMLLTAMKADSEGIVKGLELGADAFFSKPIDPPEFAAQVNVLLRIKESEDKLRQHKKDLEGLVYQRTKDLLKVNRTLADENATRRKTEELLRASEKKLRELSHYQEQVRQDERTRLARELHDELGQLITAMKMELLMLRKRVPEGLNFLSDRIDNLLFISEEAFTSMRQINASLRTDILNNLGVGPALRRLVEDFQSRTTIHWILDLEESMEDNRGKAAEAAYRIAQESFTNVVKHSKATEVRINLSSVDGDFLLSITDNGIGIVSDDPEHENTFGIMGMKERAHALGGVLEVQDMKEPGTRVTARLPMKDLASHGAH